MVAAEGEPAAVDIAPAWLGGAEGDVGMYPGGVQMLAQLAVSVTGIGGERVGPQGQIPEQPRTAPPPLR